MPFYVYRYTIVRLRAGLYTSLSLARVSSYFLSFEDTIAVVSRFHVSKRRTRAAAKNLYNKRMQPNINYSSTTFNILICAPALFCTFDRADLSSRISAKFQPTGWQVVSDFACWDRRHGNIVMSRFMSSFISSDLSNEAWNNVHNLTYRECYGGMSPSVKWLMIIFMSLSSFSANAICMR